MSPPGVMSSAPTHPSRSRSLEHGLGQADAGTRTPDPLLTMEVLYRLSYVGTNDDPSARRLGAHVGEAVLDARRRLVAELLAGLVDAQRALLG